MKRFVVVASVVIITPVVLIAAFLLSIGYYLSPQSRLAEADVIVAISGGETSARTTEAVRLYNAGWAPHIIFSGAALDPTGPSNARAMADSAIEQGVPKDAITLDEAAANTRQNAAGVAKIVADKNYHSIILVTSPYHQRRASITFHREFGADFPIINHSSYDQAWRRSHWWATTYSRNLTLSELQKVAYELVSGQSK